MDDCFLDSIVVKLIALRSLQVLIAVLVCVFAGLTVLAENEDATSHKFEWPPPPDHSVSVWTFLVISCCICIGVSAATVVCSIVCLVFTAVPQLRTHSRSDNSNSSGCSGGASSNIHPCMDCSCDVYWDVVMLCAWGSMSGLFASSLAGGRLFPTVELALVLCVMMTGTFIATACISARVRSAVRALLRQRQEHNPAVVARDLEAAWADLSCVLSGAPTLQTQPPRISNMHASRPAAMSAPAGVRAGAANIISASSSSSSSGHDVVVTVVRGSGRAGAASSLGRNAVGGVTAAAAVTGGKDGRVHAAGHHHHQAHEHGGHHAHASSHVHGGTGAGGAAANKLPDGKV